MLSSQRGSLFARDPKTSTWVLFMFAKVIVCGFSAFVTFSPVHLGRRLNLKGLALKVCVLPGNQTIDCCAVSIISIMV